MLDARPVRKTGYIVITSDKGLVGGYNSTILKAVLDMIKRDHDSEDEYAIISIGGTGSDFFKARNMNVAFELRGLEDLTIQYNRARQAAITQEITEIVGGASALE